MRVLVPFGIMLVAVGSASVAWACTPASGISGVSPSSGPAGTAVTVTGEGYSAGGPSTSVGEANRIAACQHTWRQLLG